jgi:GxxExxY protein
MDLIDDGDLTRRVIGCAIEVHHHLGPGLLESIYEAALCHELSRAGIAFVRQRKLRVKYQGVDLACEFVLDLVVEGVLVLEIKAVAQLLPIHEAQLLTYLRISGLPLGLLLNFNEVRLKDGIRRRRLSPIPTEERSK